MGTQSGIAEFNLADGFTPEQTRKLNNNFRAISKTTVSTASIGSYGSMIDYSDLGKKPQIESVTLVGNKTFPDLGIFRTDQQGHDVPDDYTLTSMDINDLWANSVPIGENNG